MQHHPLHLEGRDRSERGACCTTQMVIFLEVICIPYTVEYISNNNMRDESKVRMKSLLHFQTVLPNRTALHAR
jgi:hypothetical protein